MSFSALCQRSIDIGGTSSRNYRTHEDVLTVFTKVALLEIYFIVTLIFMTTSTMWRTTSLT